MTTDAEFNAQLLIEMRQDFLVEAEEILTRLAPLLAGLEQDASPDRLNTIFRELHTLKGSAGFVALETVRRLAHKLEDVFGALRAGKLAVTSELTDVVLAGLAQLDDLRADVARGGTGDADIRAVMAQIDRVLAGPGPAGAGPVGAGASPAPTAGAAEAVVGAQAGASPAPAAGAETTLRVDVETIDTLMNLTGELITARNTLAAHAERLHDEGVQDSAIALNRLARQLQNAVTAMRLVPIERLFNRFAPVVRNLARERNRPVRLIVEGGDTPLDRTVSEQMFDPLVHMLRNAIDHGIETAEERARAGKPAEGAITLSAERRGDTVVLRVSDDGRGIDPVRVRAVAVNRGVLDAAGAATLTDEQALRLIFAPGFSTAQTVTDLSGRGVGMDVVLQNVRHLRGTVDVETAPGRGTTLVIRLPLTLAILQVLLVCVAGRTYAVPLHVVRETLRLAPAALRHMQRGEVAFVRDEILPVRRLGALLGARILPASPNGAEGGAAAAGGDPAAALVARLTTGPELFVVDALVGKQQLVVKPLNAYLGAVRGVEGAAVLPDGSITLILNLEELVYPA
jgi:two-component system chemotaxis sensor kinase CheA